MAVAAPPVSAADGDWLTAATERSRRAGPDGAQTHRGSAFGLGHALLRTGPHDHDGPITLDGRVWISADIRLDGRGELVSRLRSAGAPVTAACSDAELALHAYSAWGERFLERIAGDFALALWDERSQRLLCARDQLGVVPLHYARDGARLYVATVIDALLLHPAISDALDESAISDFLAFGLQTDSSATAFAAVRQLPPAHLLVWSAGTIRVRRYWELPRLEPLARLPSFQAGAEQFRALLDAAVGDRLTSDRATAQLSGGMDSTSVAASAAITLRERGAGPGALRALTGVLGGDSGDGEGTVARDVARHLELPVDVLDASAMDSIDPFAEPALRTPEPTAYRYTNFEWEYARLPARHSPVTLTGHGADALLMFVPAYLIEWIGHGRAARVSRAVADQVRLRGGRPRLHLRVIARSALVARHSAPAELPPWLAPDHVARTGVAERSRERAHALGALDVRELDARSLIGDPMWATMFRYGDPSFTSEPVRFRYPFIDLRLMKFVRSLAPEPWLVNKRVLREAAADRLPSPVLRRPKTPLIAARAPGSTTDTMTGLAELVLSCPELDRFVDLTALGDALVDAGGTAPRRAREIGRALGLAHWLWHRQATPATAARAGFDGSTH